MLDLIFTGSSINEMTSVLQRLVDTLPDVKPIMCKFAPDGVAVGIGEGEKADLTIVCDITDPIDTEADTLHITFENANAGEELYNVSVADVVDAFTKSVSNTESYKSGNVVVAFDPDSTSFELMVAVSSETMKVLANVTRILDAKECSVIAGLSKGA